MQAKLFEKYFLSLSWLTVDQRIIQKRDTLVWAFLILDSNIGKFQGTNESDQFAICILLISDI